MSRTVKTDETERFGPRRRDIEPPPRPVPRVEPAPGVWRSLLVRPSLAHRHTELSVSSKISRAIWRIERPVFPQSWTTSVLYFLGRQLAPRPPLLLHSLSIWWASSLACRPTCCVTGCVGSPPCPFRVPMRRARAQAIEGRAFGVPSAGRVTNTGRGATMR